MKWRQPADRDVVRGVITAFRSSGPNAVDGALSPLSLSQWQRSYHWLDASGTALYLLHRMETLGITQVLPPPVLGRLRQNLADNRRRVDSMFAEFVALNTLFADLGIPFCNLKGFTLSPDSCPSPELRYQLDFDFLVDGSRQEECREALHGRGYELRGSGPTVLEFKSPCEKLANISDLYRPKRVFSVEIHFRANDTGVPEPDPRLDRMQRASMRGFVFPSLRPADQFINQAMHLFEHLCGAHTRASWLLEFNHHVQSRAKDTAFWGEVCEAVSADRSSSLALFTVCRLAEELLGIGNPPALGAWLSAQSNPDALRWVETYGVRALLADSPGTKLGLLLKEQLHVRDSAWRKKRRRALLPLHRAPRLLPLKRSDTWRQRLRSEALQWRYDLFRLRFHVIEGGHYLYESLHWRLSRPRPQPTPRRTSTSSMVVPE